MISIHLLLLVIYYTCRKFIAHKYYPRQKEDFLNDIYRKNISQMKIKYMYYMSVYLFGVLHHFQHCTGHITMGSWKGRGNQYIQFVRVLYCKLPTNGRQLPAFPLKAVPGTEPRSQRWEPRALPLCHCGPNIILLIFMCDILFCIYLMRDVLLLLSTILYSGNNDYKNFNL